MKKKIGLIALIACLTLVATFFINAKNQDFEKDIGGLYQIKTHKMVVNNKDESKIKLKLSRNSLKKITSSYRIINEDEPIFVGESKKVVNDLGKYRVELTLYDTRLQKQFSKELGFKTNKIEDGKGLLKNIRVAYPPDDSMMVLYFGSDDEPSVDISEDSEGIVVNLKKK